MSLRTSKSHNGKEHRGTLLEILKPDNRILRGNGEVRTSKPDMRIIYQDGFSLKIPNPDDRIHQGVLLEILSPDRKTNRGNGGSRLVTSKSDLRMMHQGVLLGTSSPDHKRGHQGILLGISKPDHKRRHRETLLVMLKPDSRILLRETEEVSLGTLKPDSRIPLRGTEEAPLGTSNPDDKIHQGVLLATSKSPDKTPPGHKGVSLATSNPDNRVNRPNALSVTSNSHHVILRANEAEGVALRISSADHQTNVGQVLVGHRGIRLGVSNSDGKMIVFDR